MDEPDSTMKHLAKTNPCLCDIGLPSKLSEESVLHARNRRTHDANLPQTVKAHMLHSLRRACLVSVCVMVSSLLEAENAVGWELLTFTASIAIGVIVVGIINDFAHRAPLAPGEPVRSYTYPPMDHGLGLGFEVRTGGPSCNQLRNRAERLLEADTREGDRDARQPLSTIKRGTGPKTT